MTVEPSYRKQNCKHEGSDNPTDVDAFCDPTCEAYVGGEGWYLVPDLRLQAITDAWKRWQCSAVTHREFAEAVNDVLSEENKR